MAVPKIEQHGEINVWLPTKDSPGYSISMVTGGWLPGIFDSVESAIKGAELIFYDEYRFVTEIQQRINHFDKEDRLITIDDLKVDWIE